jgi:16S rRNA (guanine527-N7)-methyltransferase
VGLRKWTAAQTGIELSEAQLDQLRTYLDTLLLWNRKLALISQRDPTQIISRHIADALFVASRCTDGESVVDLGSGAGFPGIPIAVARSESRLCLIESRGKKASFLEEACRSAGIRNAAVWHGRIEVLAAHPQHRERYAVATARALTSPVAFLALARPLLTPGGGRAIAMCSVTQAHAEGLPATEEVAYELPDHTPRRLLIIRPSH